MSTGDTLPKNAGIRSLLSDPRVSDLLQTLADGGDGRFDFASAASELAKVTPCYPFWGMAELLAYLPKATFGGFDISERYIKAAREHYGVLGNFECKLVDLPGLGRFPNVDRVDPVRVIHRLGDDTATRIFRACENGSPFEWQICLFRSCMSQRSGMLSHVL